MLLGALADSGVMAEAVGCHGIRQTLVLFVLEGVVYVLVALQHPPGRRLPTTTISTATNITTAATTFPAITNWQSLL